MRIVRQIKDGLLNMEVTGRKWTMYKYALRHVKRDSVATVLTGSQKKQVRDYYSKYKRVSWRFHNFYTEKTGVFYENYIPDDLYFTTIDKFYNNYRLAKVIDNKCYYEAFFSGLNQPEKILERKGGCWFCSGELISFEGAMDILEKEPEIFIKSAISSCGGKGVAYLSKDKAEDYIAETAKAISYIPSDLVVQRPIVQHKALSQLNDSSVNTVRILTMLRNNEVKIYSSLLRIGKTGAKVDNGSVSVGITPEGKLKEYGYYLNGERFTSHPGTGVSFKDYQLPSYDKAQEMVKKAHLCVPHFKMVSWDVAIDRAGEPVLIEANLSDGEINFHQLNNGPLFGDDTEEILNEVFAKK